MNHDEVRSQLLEQAIYHQYVHGFYNDNVQEYLFFCNFENVEFKTNFSKQHQYY